MSETHGDAASATAQERAHVDRLHAALREEPCCPGCANWLRYGIQPRRRGRAWRPAAAAQRRTSAPTSATAAGASSSAAAGLARPSPTTAPGSSWTVGSWLTHWLENISAPFVREN